MHAAQSGAVTDTLAESSDAPAEMEEGEEEMPTEAKFEQNLASYAHFKKEDPSTYYDITSKYKLGSGGFAKVFKVTRKSDGKVIALKFI